MSTGNETYGPQWKHAVIHWNPETGALHSDGDHSVREHFERLQGRNANYGEDDILKLLAKIQERNSEIEILDDRIRKLTEALKKAPCHCETLLDTDCYRCAALKASK